jgi:hypothetical protein
MVTLQHRGAHEQASVGAAHDGELVRLGVAVGDQVLAGRREVVEHVLFVQQGAGFVPLLTVLAASAQVGHGVDAAHLHPLQSGDREPGAEGDVEAAVAVQQGGYVPVQLHILVTADEHRDLGAVLGGVEHLLGDVVLGIEVHVGALPQGALSTLHVVAVDGGGIGVAGEGEEGLGVVGVAAEATH